MQSESQLLTEKILPIIMKWSTQQRISGSKMVATTIHSEEICYD